MTSQPILRTSYIIPGSQGQPRTDNTRDDESQVDLTQYHWPLEEVHGSSLHTWGIAASLPPSTTSSQPQPNLQVSAISGQPNLTVTTGVGLDSNGKHISLATSPTSTLGITLASVLLGAAATPTLVTGNSVTLNTTSADKGDWYLTIEWKETFDDKTWNATQLKTFQQLHTPWLRLQPTNLPNTWQGLILGHVTIDQSGNVTNIMSDGRRVAGTMVGALQVQKLTAAPAPNFTLDNARAGGIQPLASGGLDLTVANANDEIHMEVDGGGNLHRILLGADLIDASRGAISTGNLTASGSISTGSLAASGAISASNLITNGNITAYGGVIGTAPSGNGIHGIANGNGDSAVYGEHANGGIGVFGRGGPSSGEGVFGQTASASSGVYGKNTGEGNGVVGEGNGGHGVYGTSAAADAIYGISYGGSNGVFGQSTNGYGVQGAGGNAGVSAWNLGNSNAAYLASQCCAAWLTGDVHVTGAFSSGNPKQFLIDHPLDPANKMLAHASVESSEMKNVYDGTVVLGEHGEAVVELPVWFESLNTDFRYQLTPVGGPGPNLYIAEEVANGCFKIAGGAPALKVCWQVTGLRQDAWAKANPWQVEREKPVEERGYYFYPELYGAAREQSIERVRHPLPPQR